MNVIEHLKELLGRSEIFAEDELQKFKDIITREEAHIQAAIKKLESHGYTVTPPAPANQPTIAGTVLQ
jgi:hypothetical protein